MATWSIFLTGGNESTATATRSCATAAMLNRINDRRRMKVDLWCLMVAVEYTQFVHRETYQCRFFGNPRLSHHRKFGLAQITHESRVNRNAILGQKSASRKSPLPSSKPVSGQSPNSL